MSRNMGLRGADEDNEPVPRWRQALAIGVLVIGMVFFFVAVGSTLWPT